MSNNSYDNPVRRAYLRERAALADWGLDGRLNLPSVLEKERILKGDAFSRFVSAEGLALLAEAGVEVFEEVVGHRLPHNLIRSQMSGAVGRVGCVGRRLPHAEAAAEIERYARFGGWLKTAADLPALRRLLKATQSGNGVNSPYTTLDLWQLIDRWPSPHQLERKLWKVRERAVAVLSAYEGQIPSWQSIASAIMVERRVGKAAIISVAETLHDKEYWGDYFRSYREARSWLVEHRSARFSTSSVTLANEEVAFPLATVRETGSAGWGLQPALLVGRFGRRRLVELATSGDVVLALSSRSWSELAEEFEQLDPSRKEATSPTFKRLVSDVLTDTTDQLKGWRGNPVPQADVAARALLRSAGDPLRAAALTALEAIGQPFYERDPEHTPMLKLKHWSDRSYPVSDVSDGVNGGYTAKAEYAEGGTTVTRGVAIKPDGTRSRVWLVREGTRTYHHTTYWEGDALEALREARRAWLRQDELLINDQELGAFLRGELGFCPLVVRSDSDRAGNCSPGTEAWLRQRGWADRQWVPVAWLIPHMGDARVRRVAVALKRQLQRELAA